MHCLFIFVAFKNLDIKHIDCKIVFLNGNGDLKINIQQSENVISNNSKTQQSLSKHFEMQDLSYPKSFLALDITPHENDSILIDQNGYIDRILPHFHMSDVISSKIPPDPSIHLFKAAQLDKHANEKLYQQLILGKG